MPWSSGEDGAKKGVGPYVFLESSYPTTVWRGRARVTTQHGRQSGRAAGGVGFKLAGGWKHRTCLVILPVDMAGCGIIRGRVDSSLRAVLTCKPDIDIAEQVSGPRHRYRGGIQARPRISQPLECAYGAGGTSWFWNLDRYHNPTPMNSPTSVNTSGDSRTYIYHPEHVFPGSQSRSFQDSDGPLGLQIIRMHERNSSEKTTPPTSAPVSDSYMLSSRPNILSWAGFQGAGVLCQSSGSSAAMDCIRQLEFQSSLIGEFRRLDRAHRTFGSCVQLEIGVQRFSILLHRHNRCKADS